ncbi:MAG: PAS domain-containing protein, partial [Clostridiales bacterium]|nr:PAS domain-containing protein [Clostridiales bacterium]
MSLGKKLSAIIAVVLLASFGIMYMIINYFVEDMLTDSEAKRYNVLSNSIYATIEKDLEDTEIAVLSISKNPDVAKAFYEQDREALIAMFKDSYELIKENVAQFQFHLPDSTSFLRLHNIDKYGDSLKDFRFTVNVANDEKKLVTGIEEGAAGYGLRVVAPISYEGEHIGTVEYGKDFGKSFVDSLKDKYGNDYFIYKLDSEDFIAGTVEEDTWVLEKDYSEEILTGEPIYTDINSGKTAVLLLPFKDFNNEVKGYIKIIVDRSAVLARLSSMKTTIGSMAFVASLLISGLLLLVLTKLLTVPLKKITGFARQLSKGDLEVNIAEEQLKRKDEIGDLSSAFSEMILEMENQSKIVESIAKGNIDVEVNIRSDEDVLNKSISKMIDNIKDMNTTVGEIIKHSREFKLRFKKDVDHLEGTWKNIANQINEVVDVFVNIFDSLPIVVSSFDNDFNMQFVNKMGEELLGKNTKQLSGTKCYDSFNTEHCKTDKCACNRAMKEQNIVQEETISRIDGKPMDIQYAGVPIKDEDGNSIGAFEIIMDQTDIKNAQRKVEKQAKYQEHETANLLNNLEKLSKGDLKIHGETTKGDPDTMILELTFKSINENL